MSGVQKHGPVRPSASSLVPAYPRLPKRLLLCRQEIELLPVSACFPAVGLAFRPQPPRCRVTGLGRLLLIVKPTQVVRLLVVLGRGSPLPTDCPWASSPRSRPIGADKLAIFRPGNRPKSPQIALNPTTHPQARTTARAVQNEKGLVGRLGVDSSGVLLPWVGGVPTGFLVAFMWKGR